MKSKFVSACAVFTVITAWLLGGQEGLAQNSPGSKPVITKQPSDITADYGDNATVKVTAKGNRLSYQWRKNGEDITDYGNAAGAHSGILKLIGVAQEDAGQYSVVIRNNYGAVTSSIVTLTVKSSVAFSDGFEGGLTNWSRFGRDGELEISREQNITVSGFQSAMITFAGQKMYRNLQPEISGRARASFWIFDDGDPKLRSYAELRGYTGKGYMTYVAPGGLQQLIAIGCYADESVLQNSGSLKGEILATTNYQARIVAGKNTGWFNLNAAGAPARSKGWHHFEIEREADGTTLKFYVDGVLSRTVADAEHVSIDCVTIGSVGRGNARSVAWFDDIKIEAYPKKFDWKTKDSQGKGLTDLVRLRETGDDPVVTDIKRIRTVVEVPGMNANRRLGRWQNEGFGIYSLDRRGELEFSVTVTEPDAYRIEIEGREKNSKMPRVTLPLNISIDGEELGRFTLPYDRGENGLLHCLTPFLPAGRHSIRIYWDNVESHCTLFLSAVRLQALEGPDTNKNGFKDWVENRVLAQSGWDAPAASSRVSPLCVEGRGQYFSMMKITAGKGDSVIPIEPGAGHRWYVNVPLSTDHATSIRALYQNGVVEETAEVKWEETNLLLAEDTTIRKGDALRFNAAPADTTNGQVSVTIDGITNMVTDASNPIAYRFDAAGTFTVTGVYHPQALSRSITVKVVDASMDETIAAWVNRKRYWGCTNLPSEVIIESDPRIRFVEIEASERQPKLSGRQFRITTDAAENRCVVARLGTNGPILARAMIKGFRLYTPLDTYLRHTETYEDGSHGIDGGFVLSPVLPEISIDLRVLVGGITLEDGTVSRVLTASDFNELGICQVRFVRAAGLKTSVCHAAKAYENGILVGWP